MTTPTLFIYVNSGVEKGRVLSMVAGMNQVPAGLENNALIANAPNGFKTVTIDVDNKTATFEPSDEDKIEAQVAYTAMMTGTLIEED